MPQPEQRDPDLAHYPYDHARMVQLGSIAP